MSQFSTLKFVCKHCGGTKVAGEQYYALGENWIDVTCVKCSHSKDIKVKDLQDLVDKINKANAQSKVRGTKDVNNKANSK